MNAIMKFRKNVRRVKHMKYVKLENKDKMLKATMTALRLTMWLTLLAVAFPVILGIGIAISLSKSFSTTINTAAHKTTDLQGRTYYHHW